MTNHDERVEALSRFLADSYTLYLKTHNFHWNVAGPMFNTLHLMFEEQYTELATAVDEIAERIRGQASRLMAFTDELLSDAQRMADDNRQIVDVSEVLHSVMELLQDRLPAHRIDVAFDRAIVWGREGQIRQALLNILSNAARHGGDDVRVRVSTVSDQDGFRVIVDDDGPGIAAEDRERVLAPGVPLGGPGDHGLGLAAVNLVMMGHGGRIELGDSPLGGLRVELVFPEQSADGLIDLPNLEAVRDAMP